MKVGIIGTGKIAAKMAQTMSKMNDVICYAIGSRNINKAVEFARKHDIEHAYGTYEEVIKDKNIELVYIATPHSEHYKNAKLCIEHEKAVLCEKAFMANGAQAREIVALAQRKKVFLAEAIWTRYMPSRKIIDEAIGNGEIGEIISLSANLGYKLNDIPRMQNPALAGGALLDLGIYPLTFASMVMGDDVIKVTSTCTFSENGVDEQNAIVLEYPDKKLAFLHSGMLTTTDERGIVYGTKGYLIAKNINNIDKIEVRASDHTLKHVLDVPKQISGYEYEIEACQKALKNGQLFCPEAPLTQSVQMVELMDTIRSQWGLRFPFE